MKRDLPEISVMTRMRGVSSLKSHYSLINVRDNYFFTDRIFFVDSTYFNVFEHNFILGDPNECLNSPGSIVLTKSFAERIFGKEDPFGKNLEFEWRYTQHPAKVTGIIEDPPANTHMPFDAVISWSSQNFGDRYDNTWIGALVYTYFKLIDEESRTRLENGFEGFIDTHMKEVYDRQNLRCEFSLMELKKIHLESHMIYEPYENGSKSALYIFGSLGLALLIVVLVNYINNSTAVLMDRSKSLAIKKIWGVGKSGLIGQFLLESVIIVFTASLIALGISALSLPYLNKLSANNMSLFGDRLLFELIILIACIILIGLLSGIVPAWLNSRVQPLMIMKKEFSSGKTGKRLRQVLIILQLSISICMIMAILRVNQQFRFLTTEDKGFDHEKLLSVQLKDSILIADLPVLIAEIESIPFIEGATAVSNMPGDNPNRVHQSLRKGSDEPVTLTVDYFSLRDDSPEVLGFQLLKGRFWDRESYNDSSAVMINEAAARRLGWMDESMDDKYIYYVDDQGNQFQQPVIGIMKDFQLTTLHEPIEPMILYYNDIPIDLRLYMVIRYNPEFRQETITVLNDYFSGYPLKNSLDINVVDDLIKEQYSAEWGLLRFVKIISVIILFLSCLGVIGTVNYITRIRLGQIAIRKVFGAPVKKNLLVLTRELRYSLLISVIIGLAASTYVLDRWIEQYAMKTVWNIWYYPLSVIFIIAIIAIVSYSQIYKTLRYNPIDIIRNE